MRNQRIEAGGKCKTCGQSMPCGCSKNMLPLSQVRNRLMQLYRDNAGSGGRFEVKAFQAEGQPEEATIYLYDAIGDWYGIGALEFAQALAGITAPKIHLRINSPGGDCFDARAMQTLLMQHQAQVIAHIDGVAASAATFLAMAADEIEMTQGARFMVHNSWGLCIGNKNDMTALAGLLDTMDHEIAQDYQKKCGQTMEQIQALMDAETWMTAQEALDAGLVDRIYTGQPVENRWNLRAYDRAPQDLLHPDQAPAQYDRATIERRLVLIENTGR